jgi:hypothetical protein
VKQAAKMSAGDSIIARAILIDDDAKDFLDCLEMKKVLSDAKSFLGSKIDLLGMDACLMSMAEIACQISNSVSFMAGSEETEPLDGWPYNTILGYLAENPETTPQNLSKIIVQKYIESYKGNGEAVTQSACGLTASGKFSNALKTLAETLTAGLADEKTQESIADARNRVQEYQVNDNIDLINFCQLVKSSPVPSAIRRACDTAIAAVKKPSGLVLASGYNGSSMKHSNGLAIYFPTRTLSPLYARLDFAKKTGWGAFLKAFIAATRSQ